MLSSLGRKVVILRDEVFQELQKEVIETIKSRREILLGSLMALASSPNT